MTKKRRKSCQSCRFQKCLKEGMLKEGIRLDGLRGARQRKKTTTTTATVAEQQLKTTTTAVAHQEQSANLAMMTADVKSLKNDENILLQHLLQIEPQKVYALPNVFLGGTLVDDESRMMSMLADLFDRELMATIGWAKQVPGFTSLPLSDQMNLLQGSWLDVLCFNVAFRSSPYKGFLVYADDLIMSEADSLNGCIPLELNVMTRKLARKLSELALTREEYVLMKVMLLLNPDLSVENQNSVQRLRDETCDAMLDYERSRCSEHHRRLGNLLFVMPTIAHCRLLARDYWRNIRLSGSVPLNKLLSEMVDCFTDASVTLCNIQWRI